jgi:hypothetical protein
MVSLVTPRLEVLALSTEDGEPEDPPDATVEDVLDELALLQPAVATRMIPAATRAVIRVERFFQAR